MILCLFSYATLVNSDKDNLKIGMYLIIDIGNTRVKAAVFHRNKQVESLHFTGDVLRENIRNISQKYPIKQALISAVGSIDKEDMNYLKKRFPLVVLNAKTPVPFTNRYATPESLGVDRMALAAAAVSQYPETNVLVIDAGTCVTYDIVTDQKEYLGGAIAPGLNSRYKALHDYTANLPLLTKEQPESFVGNSTESSIHSGVVNGMCREIDGVITQYKVRFKKLTVVLTGGDAEFLSSQLKNSIFVRPFFMTEGLFTILKYNIP